MRNQKICLFAFALAAIFTVSCNDDEPAAIEQPVVLPQLLIENARFIEGDDNTSSVSIAVQLTGTSIGLVEVGYSIENGSATVDEDFSGEIDGILVFDGDDTEQEINFTIIGDDTPEGDEDFTIRLSDPVNATLPAESITITVKDDDARSVSSSAPNDGYRSAIAYPEMDLLWSNEFIANELESAEWTWELGNGNNGWGNSELQYYREENTTMEGGNLVITAKKENFGSKFYTSSRIISKDKVEFQFGRIDIRAAMPQGQGLWPALWMLGANIDDVGWPACGEIDIMELVGHEPGVVHGTAHFGASASERRYLGRSKDLDGDDTFADEFHVFSLVWERDKIQWLLDGELYNILSPSQVSPAAWPFNKEFFMIFNVAVGGQWPGVPDATTTFPQQMHVDYIRVFQEK
ncbi:MAG: family 16 glycosylhydrolase [Saprospiraceae bacterium]